MIPKMDCTQYMHYFHTREGVILYT